MKTGRLSKWLSRKKAVEFFSDASIPDVNTSNVDTSAYFNQSMQGVMKMLAMTFHYCKVPNYITSTCRVGEEEYVLLYRRKSFEDPELTKWRDKAEYYKCIIDGILAAKNPQGTKDAIEEQLKKKS